MIGERVTWETFSPFGGLLKKSGMVVNKDGDWIVIRADHVTSPHISPFVSMRYQQVELIAERG